MKVTSNAIVDGYYQNRFGKHGDQFDQHGSPNRSIDFHISDAPAGTVSFSVFLEDKDSIPVCGFAWIHWLAANIRKTDVEENESCHDTDFIQGSNSLYRGLSNPDGGVSRLEASHYTGMAPPDCDHEYELHVYALDTELDLQTGFYWNELYHAMQGHILAEETIAGIYPSEI